MVLTERAAGQTPAPTGAEITGQAPSSTGNATTPSDSPPSESAPVGAPPDQTTAKDSAARAQIADATRSASEELEQGTVTASPPPGTRECIDAHIAGQEARLANQLLEAHSALQSCASEYCPQLVRDDCMRLANLVSGETPTIILVSDRPADSSAVRVTVDGVAIEKPSFGIPTAFNPGTHQVVFVAEGYQPVETTVTLVAGGAPIRLEVSLTPETPPEPPIGKTPSQTARDPHPAPIVNDDGVPAATYVLGGVAVVAAGLATHFALTGLDERRKLQGECAPLCASRQVDDVERQLLYADISAGVSLIAVTVAAMSYFTRSTSDSDTNHTPDRNLRIALDRGRIGMGFGGRF